ncbi:uncharacterized protein LOC108153298 [Drosophila miranda]|uniref:uncharacterized protein LOC108153298 n=1 Tax=Drosophila miranda TaxID=7229 RepID=UPI0007E7FC8D|nr:uncharacterized protein LOC108153298 [Drosophila miranda]
MPLKLQQAFDLLFEKVSEDNWETPKIIFNDMEEINQKIYKALEIRNSAVKDEHPLYKFRLTYIFPNDPTTYLDNGKLFWTLDQTTQEKVKNEARKAYKLLFHLSGNLSKVDDALFAAIDKQIPSDAIELTLEGLKHIITVSDNPGHLSFVYNKLMDLKQSDSVDVAELMALFGLH